MKRLKATVLIIVLLFCSIGATPTNTEPKYANVKVSSDDQLQTFPLYGNGGGHTSGKNRISVYTANYKQKNILRFLTYIPKSLEEAYEFLDNILSDEDKEYIKNGTDSDLIVLHFSLGMWIRNQWIYSTYEKRTHISKVFLDRGINHPDDMSSSIIYGYRRYLNSSPSDTETIVSDK